MMASVTPYAAGYAVKWYHPAGKQWQARLRGFDRPAAEEAAEHVAAMIRAARSRRPVPYVTERYVQHVAPRNLVAALTRSGLHDDRRGLVNAIDAYVDHKSAKVLSGRLADINRELYRLAKFIGWRVDVSDVIADDIHRWADSIAELEPSTQSKYAAIARSFFRWCAKEGLIEKAPTDGLQVTTFAAQARQEISDVEYENVIDVVDRPSRQALHLCRYAGLRIGEAVNLQWSRVDYHSRKMTVQDTKRKRDRAVPIVPEMRLLFAGFDKRGNFVVADGDSHPLSRSAVDKRIREACARARVRLWPRLFHNLRATRETEWINQFGLVNACHWIGNSQAVASKHYAMATAAAFNKATADTTEAKP